jgi:hypothetical protein
MKWRKDKPNETDTFICMIQKRENGITSLRPEYVKYYDWKNGTGEFIFDVGHEEGWEVIEWLDESEVEWIRVEDGELPEDMLTVLVTRESDKFVYMGYHIDGRWYFEDDQEMYGVIAWQPQPPINQ